MDPGPAEKQAGRELGKPGEQDQAAGKDMRIETNAPITDMINMLFGPQECDIASHSRIRKRKPDHHEGKEGQGQQQHYP
jgi:hypothetical protein